MELGDLVSDGEITERCNSRRERLGHLRERLDSLPELLLLGGPREVLHPLQNRPDLGLLIGIRDGLAGGKPQRDEGEDGSGCFDP